VAVKQRGRDHGEGWGGDADAGFDFGSGEAGIGPVEFSGVVGNGLDPSASNSYYTIQTGQAFSAPGSRRQKFRARNTRGVGKRGGFQRFQAQEAWTITHELKLAPVKIQGRTVDMKITSYRAMAKCMPAEPTMANIDAALLAQGGAALHGARLSSTAADLVITGAQTVSVTVKNAALKTAGFVFGGKACGTGNWICLDDQREQRDGDGGAGAGVRHVAEVYDLRKSKLAALIKRRYTKMKITMTAAGGTRLCWRTTPAGRRCRMVSSETDADNAKPALFRAAYKRAWRGSTWRTGSRSRWNGRSRRWSYA